jgi:tetratricopeptide (TPR) repeat protein
MESSGGGLLARRKLTEEDTQAKHELIEAGNAAFDDDDFELALKQYHKASLIDSADAATWCSLGLTYSNMGFTKEAWRSYKLALQADPEHVDSLWYAGEFLYNQEDLELALPILQQYIALEKDEQRLAEAKELVEEISAVVSADETGSINPLLLSGVDSEGNELDPEEDPLEGFEFDDDAGGGADDDDYDFDDDTDYEELPAETFQAGLQLILTGMQAKCANCSASIPEDAPYCYSCKAPHFYP